MTFSRQISENRERAYATRCGLIATNSLVIREESFVFVYFL